MYWKDGWISFPVFVRRSLFSKHKFFLNLLNTVKPLLHTPGAGVKNELTRSRSHRCVNKGKEGVRNSINSVRDERGCINRGGADVKMTFLFLFLDK